MSFDMDEQTVLAKIDEQVKNNPVVLYMKGTPQMPSCGFSSRTAAGRCDYF